MINPPPEPHESDHDPVEAIDLAFADYLRRRDAGPVDVQALLEQYPDLRSELEELIQDEEGILGFHGGSAATVIQDTAPRSFPTEPQSFPRQLGDFLLLREVGRGGMGVVYEAQQTDMQRNVAVKVLPPQDSLDTKRLRRFKTEVQAAGQLDHPNIVPVYASSVTDGVHYYAMKYIHGVNLAQITKGIKRPLADTRNIHSDPTAPITESDEPADSQADTATRNSGTSTRVAIDTLIDLGRSTSVRKGRQYFKAVALIFADAANALQHAHETGVIHRDIKPANLMLEYCGGVWITDFGLAQIRDTPGQSETQTDTLIGTLRYMSPEQAYAKRLTVDHRTDIYSLGITLFEMLTLEPAFEAESHPTLLRMVAFEEPKRPRAIRGSIPVDLETITLKAISKKPDDRYETAAAFAEDLHRFIEGKPILAKPATAIQKLFRWAARNQTAVVSLVAITLLVGLFGTALGVQELKKAKAELKASAADGLRLATYAGLEPNPSRAVRYARQAFHALPGPETCEALNAALDKSHELRLIRPTQMQGAASISRDGNWILTTSKPTDFAQQGRRGLLFEISSEETKTTELVGNGTITSAAFSPSGSRVLTVAAPRPDQANKYFKDGSLSLAPQVFEVKTGEKLLDLSGCSVSQVFPENFSPDGKKLVIPAGKMATVFDVVDGDRQLDLQGHEARIVYAGFSPTGKYIATADETGEVKVWSRDGAVFFEPGERGQGGKTRTATTVSFSPDDRVVAVASNEHGVLVYSLEKKALIESGFVAGSTAEFIGNSAYVAYGREGSVRTLDGRMFPAIANGIVAVSPNGDLCATRPVNRKQQIRVVETITGEEVAVLNGHDEVVRSVSFSTDGQKLVSVSDKSVRLWSTRSGKERRRFGSGELATNPPLAASRNGVLIGSSLADYVSIRDVEAKTERKRLPGKLRFAASHMGERLVVSGRTATVVRGVAEVATTTLPQQVSQVFLHSQTKSALFLGTSTIWIWDYETGETHWIATDKTLVAYDAAFSPKGEKIALGRENGELRILDLAGRTLQTLRPPAPKPINSIVYFSDGRKVATCQTDGKVTIWDLDRGEVTLQLKAPASVSPREVQLSRDNKFLVAYFPGTATPVAVWDMASGELVGTQTPPGRLRSLRIHPSGIRLLLAGTNGLAEWDHKTGNLDLRSESATAYAVYNSDGTEILSATDVTQRDPLMLPSDDRRRLGGAKLFSFPIEGGPPVEIAEGRGSASMLDADEEVLAIAETRFGYQLFNPATGKLLHSNYDHAAPLCFVGSSGDRLATASWDGTAFVYDATSGKAIHRVSANAPIIAGDLSSKALAIGASDGSVSIFDVRTGEMILTAKHEESVSHVRFSPDLAQLVSVSIDGSLISTDIASGLQTRIQLSQSISTLDFTQDGTCLLIAPRGVFKTTLAGVTDWFPNESTNDAFVLENLKLPGTTKFSHKSQPLLANYSPSGSKVLTATESGVFIWDAASGTRTLEYLVGKKIFFAGWISADRVFIHTSSELVIIEINTSTVESVFPVDSTQSERRLTPAPQVISDDSILVFEKEACQQLYINPTPRLNGLGRLEPTDSESVRHHINDLIRRE